MTHRLSLVLPLLLGACGEGAARPAAPATPVEAPAAKDPRDKNIELSKRLLRATDDDDPQKPDFHFRLASLYEAKWREPFPQDRDPTQWLEQAIASYRSAAAFPKYPRAAETLFKLACLLQAAGREAEAREQFDRIIKEYPESKYVSEAWARRR